MSEFILDSLMPAGTPVLVPTGPLGYDIATWRMVDDVLMANRIGPGVVLVDMLFVNGNEHNRLLSFPWNGKVRDLTRVTNVPMTEALRNELSRIIFENLEQFNFSVLDPLGRRNAKELMAQGRMPQFY